jgi:hypothetical protein
LLPFRADHGGEGAVKLRAIRISLLWKLGRVLLALASSFCCLVLAPWWRQRRPRKFDWRFVRDQGSFPPAAYDDKLRPLSGPQGCRAPAPVASTSCAGDSLASLPQVAWFPGGRLVAGALLHGCVVISILPESSRT